MSACVHNRICYEPLKVGIRKFRAHLTQYLLETDRPVAVTRHGETIGYFIPSCEYRTKDDLMLLKEAAVKLDALLASYGIDEDEMVAEFRNLRSGKAG